MNTSIRDVSRTLARRCFPPRQALLTVLAGAGMATCGQGAPLVISENFDSMGSGGTTLPAGWSAGYLGAESSSNRLTFAPYAGNGLSITNMPVAVYDGTGALPTPNVGTIFNMGTPGGADRALGSYPRTTPSGDHVFQLSILNTTGGPLTEVTISYAGEQWNQAQGTSTSGPEMIRVLVSTESPTDFFQYYAQLDFTAPQQGPNAAGNIFLDGDNPANRMVITANITLPTAVPVNGSFYVRWHDWNDNGTSDHFLAIDDVMITSVVPEPGAAVMLGLSLTGLCGRRLRCRRQTGKQDNW